MSKFSIYLQTGKLLSGQQFPHSHHLSHPSLLEGGSFQRLIICFVKAKQQNRFVFWAPETWWIAIPSRTSPSTCLWAHFILWLCWTDPEVAASEGGVMSDKMVYLYIWVEEKHSVWVYMRVCTQPWVHVYVCDCYHKTLTSLSGETAWQDECNWLSQLYLCMLMREAGLQRVLQRQMKNAT